MQSSFHPHQYCPWDGSKYLPNESTCTVCGIRRESGHTRGKKSVEQKPWRKILYERQLYDDNYVDESFLGQMRTNVTVEAYDYWTTVTNSTTVCQQISSAVAFLIVYYYTVNGSLSIKFLLMMDAVLFCIGYCARLIFDFEFPWSKVTKNMRSSVLFVLALYALSPVLRTLTKSYETDTIYALVFVFGIIHMFFYDYSYVNAVTNKFAGTVSLNAAIIASILLASRLQSTVYVFAFIMFAIEIFGLLPVCMHYMKSFSPDLYIAWTIAMFAITTALLIPMFKLLALLYIVGALFVTFVCPLWLISIMKYKHEIQGPWDEAIPRARSMTITNQ
eukprot:GFYU01003243.1.p1 GENE.GFYU01003243.1~~GFYU01003243.1.p1  ORF type:complete len:332 (-),score=89.81 GFYU01003243.1:116-1111(-)